MATTTDLGDAEAAAAQLVATRDPQWLDAFAAALHRRRIASELANVLTVWELSRTEAGQLLGVTRQAISKWIDGAGVPADRTPQVADLAAATDLLEHYLKASRIPAVVRRPAAALGGRSLLDLVADGATDELLAATRDMFKFTDAHEQMRTELLADAHPWLRICEASWDDPLDDTFAQRRGGRWNPPDSWRTLYLNEDEVTARLNLRAFVRVWPYEPEDLRADTGPQLAVATLPRDQQVADAHSPAGVTALGLPVTYPHTTSGELVDHATCQQVGSEIRAAGLRGVRCRSAQTPHGAGRELAWFPVTARSRATLLERRPFPDWYWS